MGRLHLVLQTLTWKAGEASWDHCTGTDTALAQCRGDLSHTPCPTRGTPGWGKDKLLGLEMSLHQLHPLCLTMKHQLRGYLRVLDICFRASKNGDEVTPSVPPIRSN